MARKRKTAEPAPEPPVEVEAEVSITQPPEAYDEPSEDEPEDVAPHEPEPAPEPPPEPPKPRGFTPLTEIEYIPKTAELNPNMSVRAEPTHWDERAQAEVVTVIHDMRPEDIEGFLKRGRIKPG